METDITKGLTDQSEKAIEKAYDDLIHPTAEPVGQILSYLPRTIRLLFAKWEKWLVNGEENLRLTSEALKEKVSKIPEEKLCEPEPYVAVPAMQQLAYCYDSNELRNLYANLLASSMNADKKWLVHPGYVDIIKQLTPDEAKMLSIMPNNTNHYYPLIDLKIKLGDYNAGEMMIKQNYTNIADSICDNPDNISLYIDDLSRLKIIEIPWGRNLTDSSKYDQLKTAPFIERLKASFTLHEGQQFDFNEKVFNVTDFGLGFIKCCIEEPQFSSQILTEQNENLDQQ